MVEGFIVYNIHNQFKVYFSYLVILFIIREIITL